MTNEEHRRLTAALTRKVRGAFDDYYGDPEAAWECIVGTVIVDTVCVVEGVIPIEAYES